MMEFRCFILFILSGIILIKSCATTRFNYILSAPKQFRVDTNNLVVISTQNVDHHQPRNLELTIKCGDYLKKENFVFNKDGLQTVNIFIPSSKVPSSVQDVTLDLVNGRETQGETIPLIKSTGFIFIQTDKPIYSPRDIVKFRVLAINEDQSPSNRKVTVDITNPSGIILDRMTYESQDAFTKKEFHLPTEADLGLWNITAAFGKDTNVSVVEFEVREYVLPKFGVTIKPQEKVINQTMDYVNIDVEAKYSYTIRNLKGKCTLKLGYIVNDQIILFKKTYTSKLRSSGSSSFRIPMKRLLRSHSFPPHGTPLFIEVNVTERITKIQETDVDMTSVFATNPYKIEYSSSKQYFVPEYPYQLNVDVLDAANRPVSGTDVKIILLDGDQQKDLFETQTDQSGRCLWVLNKSLTKAALELKFTVYVSNGQDMKSSETIVVKMGYNRAISLAENDVDTVQKTLNVKVRFEHEEGRLFFVMVLSKGRIIWTDKFYSDDSGVKIVHLPEKYKDELSPFARVIVYHHGLYLNADSLTIDFPDKCLDQLQVLHSGIGITSKISTPNDKYKVIRLKGSPGMTVGLVAVDKSVYYLNDKISLTKESLQKEMLKRDTGSKTVQSQNGIEIFRDNGLLVLQNDNQLSDIGRPLNRLGGRVYNSPHNNDLIPYKNIRTFFPETFMFEDVVLNSRGTYKHKFLLPDTVTTWVIHAVGISASRGLCVAEPIQFHAYLRFHIKLQLPHKVVRLEQVKVKLSVYNYMASTKFKFNITGDLGLCFPRWEVHCGSFRTVKKYGISSCEFDVIPFRTGDLAIRVGVWDQSVTPVLLDAVEKKLHVVPEGKRLQKTITFALDPEGNKLQSVTAERIVLDGDSVMDNDTLNNTTENIQQTEVDLALPTEIIPGTESCGIQACGDLMGDVISTVMFDTGDVFVSSFYGGEEIIGNLAPIVYALEYLSSLDLLNTDMYDRSRRSITKGVTQLMKYRNKYGPFSLNKDSLPSTWFTALVLKTLCHTSNIKFIDDRLIKDGFMWILDQVDEEGRPKELEFRLQQKNKNYTVMLAAEILIAQKECNKSQALEQEMLEFKLAVFIEENIDTIKNPLVLSKMAYALQLSESPETEQVTNKFIKAAKSSEGLTYWSDNGDEEGVPLWYRQGADSYSIETTAYGLLLYLNNPNLDPNPLADWLIRKRNRNGGFVSPTDTSIAIQALAKFSKLKHSKTTDLHMEISSDISTNFNEVLNFNTENAIQQKEVRNVPVGEKLNIKTKGKGLGQMKVRVAYNVPTTPNDHCMFDLKVERKEITIPKRQYYKHYSICKYCKFGCDLDKRTRIARSVRRKHVKTKKNRISRKRTKKTRKSKPIITKKSLCLKICLRYIGGSSSGPTNVEIEMLSGYKPMDEDLNIINELSGKSVKNTKYNDGLLTVYLSEVSNNASTCLYLRVKEDEMINYLQPVPVVVFQPSRPEEICLKNYDVGNVHQTLPVYCIEDDNMKYKGECQCLSESCGQCKKMRLYNLQQKFCDSDVVYNITIDKKVKSEASKDITAVLNTILKEGDHDIADGESIELRTSLACSCPNLKTGESLVLVGRNPKRFVNRNMEVLYRYIVDETTTFVNVTEERGPYSHGRTNFIRAFYKQCIP